MKYVSVLLVNMIYRSMSMIRVCLPVVAHLTRLHSVFPSGMTIPEEDTEAGQTGKYCLVAIGRLQVCVAN